MSKHMISAGARLPSGISHVIEAGGGLLLALVLTLLIQSAPVNSSTPIVFAAPTASNTLASHSAITLRAYLPVLRATSSSNFTVDPQHRQSVLAFYLEHYLGWQNTPIDWTGNVNNCLPGSTPAAFREAVAHRINYFRAMAGVPPTIRLKDEYNAKAQAAALLMSANINLSHDPPPSWDCHTDDGAIGARHSDLALGLYGWDAVNGYMQDADAVNDATGHRRWLLYPQTQFMGTGDIPPALDQWAANALWVFDDNLWGPRPATRHEFVAWPPPGYVPYPVVYARWTFSYPNADFSAATIDMTSAGRQVALTALPVYADFGDNTLAWLPLGLDSAAAWPRPHGDMTFIVNIHNVIISGHARTFTYTVIVFDPQP